MATTAEIDRFLNALIGFESGGNATAQNPSGSASGLFGYIDSTWAGYGGYAHAKDAPPEVQWAKARADVANKLARYDGDWRSVAMSWYLPAAVGNDALANQVPEGGNTKTPNEYADLVMSRFTGKQTNTVSGGTTVATSTAKPKTQSELLTYIEENYPDVAALLKINSEVKAVLLEAAANGYTRTRLQSELAKTKWWRTTAASARTWDADYARDKATGDQLLEQTRRDLAAQASRLGVPLTDADLRKMALNVRRLGWTPQQTAEALAGRFRQSTAKAGMGTALVSQLRDQARDYGVGVSDRELTQWTQRILAGQADEAGWRDSLVKRAKTLYASIADEIDAGVTVADYFQPYAERAAQILGLNPDEVDFRDARWQRALAQPTEGGKRVPMDFSQWETELKTNALYGYRQTKNGRAEEASFATSIARMMGVPA